MLAGSSVFLLSTDDARDAYVCPPTGEVYVFPDGVSGAVSAGGVVCASPYYTDDWEPLCPYLEVRGSSCDLLTPPNSTVPTYCRTLIIVDGGVPQCTS